MVKMKSKTSMIRTMPSQNEGRVFNRVLDSPNIKANQVLRKTSKSKAFYGFTIKIEIQVFFFTCPLFYMTQLLKLSVVLTEAHYQLKELH